MNIKSFFQITKGSSTSGTSSTDNDQLKVDRKRKIEESKADVSNLLINKEAPRKRSKNTTKNYKNEEDDDDVVSIIIEDDLFDNLSSKKALKSPNKVKANPTSSNSPTSKHIKMKPESSTDNIQKMESKDIFEEGEDHYITSPSGKKRKTLSKSPIRKKSNGQTSIDKKSTTSAVEGKRGHKHTKTERLSFLQKSSFKDLCFVFTGDLQTVSREEMEEKVKRYNGLLRTSVSGNTDFLIVGQNPGQKKMEKAQELQETLVQLTEQEFLAWFAKVEHQFYIDQKELEDRQLLLASEGETLSDDVADGARDRDSIIQKDSIVNSSKIGTNESAIGIKSSLVKNVQLWTEKYRPHQTDEVIGGLSQINKIKTFLQEWNATSTGRGGASTKRALLISGFPGIGKV